MYRHDYPQSQTILHKYPLIGAATGAVMGPTYAYVACKDAISNGKKYSAFRMTGEFIFTMFFVGIFQGVIWPYTFPCFLVDSYYGTLDVIHLI